MARFAHRSAPPGSRYGDQRHYVVPDSLDEGDLLVMYQTVLNEATTTDDLECWLDGDILRRLWPTMWLPGRLRARWEARFPELSSQSSLANPYGE